MVVLNYNKIANPAPMNKSLLIHIIIFAGVVFFTSCASDKKIEPTCNIPAIVSFGNDIIPIFETRCALPGCHIQSHPTLDLQTPVAFQNLLDVNEIDLQTPTNSKIYRRITGITPPQMPLGNEPLSNCQMETILTWIQQGATNN